MQGYDFSSLHSTLLRGGMAPRHAKRAIKEMRQHLADLEADALGEGLTPEEAESRAQQTLGEKDEIARQFLARPELISWSHRYPKTIYLLGPLFSFCALFVLINFLFLFLSISFLDIFDSSGVDEPRVLPPWFVWLCHLVLGFTVYALMPLLAISYCLSAKRHMISMRWPLVGAILLTVLAAGFNYHVAPEGVGEQGQGSIGIAWGWRTYLLPRFLQVDSKPLWKILPTLVVLAFIYYRYQPHSIRSTE